MINKKDFYDNLTAGHRANNDMVLSNAAQAKSREPNRELASYLEQSLAESREKQESKQRRGRPSSAGKKEEAPPDSSPANETEGLPKRKGRTDYKTAVGEHFRSTGRHYEPSAAEDEFVQKALASKGISQTEFYKGRL